MAIIKSTVRVGEKPPTEVLLRLREARNYPVNLEACPEAAPEALREFAAMAAERSRRGRRQAGTAGKDRAVLKTAGNTGEGKNKKL
jgi:hypothetical protein